jgi:hypothetical protein
VSPGISDEEEDDVITSNPKPNLEFYEVDLANPTLKLQMKFSNIQLFREAVKEYNVMRGKDIWFKKNEKCRCVAVCRDPACHYRVYARKMLDEESFQIRSLQHKHTCTRKYKNSIVNSKWMANKLFDKFKIQPDMPLPVILDEVKRKWNVDVSRSQMYRARRKASKRIHGKLEEQYARLWDYCETLRQTNMGSCVLMSVDRPMPDLPPKFERIYLSLAAMTKGFVEGCRPVIGLDGCFLKGPFKGTLLAAVGRDANNNMYPIAIAVVEAETKDSWSWFLEALMSNLRIHKTHSMPTFISDRQKVSDNLFQNFHIFLNMFYD